MKKGAALLIAAGMLLALGLGRRVEAEGWGGGGECPCGYREGSCASCVGQTGQDKTLYCEGGRGNASDPLCDKGKEESCSSCPAGTVKTCDKSSPVYSGSALYRAPVFPLRRFQGKISEKQIEVIYVEEAELIITVTVYVFYGEWKD